MDIEELRAYCLQKPDVREGTSFGEDVLVFYAQDRMFALIALDRFPLAVNLKCDPGRALELRERYACVQPGYHMNKKHWNTIVLDGELTDAEMRELVDHSYDLVLQKAGEKRTPRRRAPKRKS
jgi:predicted DNA-binding protein (MmcQ/YjbR family)